MKIIEVVEPLVSLVLIGSNQHVNDEENFVFCVTEQYLEAIKNLEFLGLSQDTTENARHAITFFVDEIMMTNYKNWSLLQMKYYQTNCGGEEFFQLINKSLEKKKEERDDSYIELVSLYDFLLSLGFKGKYWSGQTDAVTKIRSDLNGIIGIDSTVSLVNSSVEVKDKSSLRRINLISIIVMVFVVLCTILVSLLYNDYLNSHNEIWLEVLRHLLQDQ